jgi:hypothetical protein
VDQHRSDADPDPNFHVDADPDPEWHLNHADLIFMWIVAQVLHMLAN